MSEKTARRVKEMKYQTFGVEVEMNNIERKNAAKIAADFFGTAIYSNTAERNGYSTYSAWDAWGREWKFQKDVSIAGPDSEKCEMVTPILTYADIETLQGLIRRLRKAGAKSDATRGCGVHIHIGANGHNAKTLRNLANIMASHESLIADALNLDRRRMNHYCRTVNPKFLEQLNKKKPNSMMRAHYPPAAENAGGHLVRFAGLRIQQNATLQQQPLPHAQPPRNIHQRHD